MSLCRPKSSIANGRRDEAAQLTFKAVVSPGCGELFEHGVGTGVYSELPGL